MGIIIFGLNGSGKSTLAKALALQLKFKYMDIEAYYFFESDVPYTKKRSKAECCELILDDINKHENFILSVVNGDLGEEITSHYQMGVFLEVSKDIRIERVKQRASSEFGDRIEPGGDMYELVQSFIEFAKLRNPETIEDWSKKLTIPVLRLDGTNKVSENVDRIINQYSKLNIKAQY